MNTYVKFGALVIVITGVLLWLAIRRDELREPERLMGFVRTVVNRQVAAYIDEVVHSRRDKLNLDLGLCVAKRRLPPEDGVHAGDPPESFGARSGDPD